MRAKMLEIRDKGTFVPALAVRLESRRVAEGYLLGRAGFVRGRSWTLLIHLTGLRVQWDPVGWGDRTMQAAHRYVELMFDELEPGEVVDVEHVLGETETAKGSEREQTT